MKRPTMTQLEALRCLVDLHGPTGPKEWLPEHWDAAEVAAGALVPVLAVAERFVEVGA